MQILRSRFRDNDRLLPCGGEPPLGAHLVTPRVGFSHHGIYVGAGKVVHYGALGRYRLGGAVAEVSLADFSRGHTVWVRSHERIHFDRAEVIRRARSRIGEDCYRLVSNNCEHFCEWCLRGEHRSYQVESFLSLPRLLKQTAVAAVDTTVRLFFRRNVLGGATRGSHQPTVESAG